MSVWCAEKESPVMTVQPFCGHSCQMQGSSLGRRFPSRDQTEGKSCKALKKSLSRVLEDMARQPWLTCCRARCCSRACRLTRSSSACLLLSSSADLAKCSNRDRRLLVPLEAPVRRQLMDPALHLPSTTPSIQEKPRTLSRPEKLAVSQLLLPSSTG